MEHTKHLTEEQIAFCAEAINSGEYVSIAKNLRLHLEQCNQCASEVVMVAEISDEISSHEIKKKKLKYSFKPFYYSIAASVLLFGAIYAIHKISNSLNNLDNLSETKPVIEHRKSIKTIAPSKNIAKIKTVEESIKRTRSSKTKVITSTDENLAFATHPQLEKLAQNFSSSYRSESGNIIAKSIITTKKTDSIAWKCPQNEALIIEIYNNKGTLSFDTTTNKNSIKIPKLQNGLYYWKLINQDYDLLFVGKIEVK